MELRKWRRHFHRSAPGHKWCEAGSNCSGNPFYSRGRRRRFGGSASGTLVATAAVQLAEPLQNAELPPPKTVSKNGCAVTLAPGTPLKINCSYSCPNVSGKTLATQCGVDRYVVQVGGLVLVRDFLADVTDFQVDVRAQFTLQGEGEVVGAVRSEVRIEGLGVDGFRTAPPGVERLRPGWEMPRLMEPPSHQYRCGRR